MASSLECNVPTACFDDVAGEMLIYPYYRVKEETPLSVAKVSDAGMLVKVRFLEGYESREVRDYNMYLSPHDVWTAGKV